MEGNERPRLHAVLSATKPPSATESSPQVQKPPSMWSMVVRSARKGARYLAIKMQTKVRIKMLEKIRMHLLEGGMRSIIYSFAI